METATPGAVGLRREGAPAPSALHYSTVTEKLCAQLPILAKMTRCFRRRSGPQNRKRKKRASASLGQAAADKTPPPHERFLEAFRWMLLARTLEEKLVSLYRGGQITGGVYIGKGQEAVSVACGLFLEKGDIFAPLIRDQAGRSAFGEPLVDVTRTYLGSRLGPMRGRDGNIHRGHPRDNELAMISHLGAMVSVTVGTLMAKRFRGEKDFVGLTCIGEGGMQTGAFHEGMNIAAVEQVPLVVVATNNHYAYSTPNDREFACDDLMERAIGYGFEGYSRGRN